MCKKTKIKICPELFNTQFRLAIVSFHSLIFPFLLEICEKWSSMMLICDFVVVVFVRSAAVLFSACLIIVDLWILNLLNDFFFVCFSFIHIFFVYSVILGRSRGHQWLYILYQSIFRSFFFRSLSFVYTSILLYFCYWWRWQCAYLCRFLLLLVLYLSCSVKLLLSGIERASSPKMF